MLLCLQIHSAYGRHDNFTPPEWKQNDSKLEPMVKSKIQAMLASPPPVESAGCHASDGQLWEDGDIIKLQFEGITREFTYRAATNQSVPAVLVVVFHSYYFDMDFVEDWSEWTAFRDANPYLPLAILYPNGAGDSLVLQDGNATRHPDEQVPIRGWNSLGNTGVGNATCDPAYAATAGGYPAYQSCLNKGHPFVDKNGSKYAAGCDSGPCSDDVGFVAHIVQQTMEAACIDRRRVFASGQSNGGMMTEQVGEDARTAALFAAGVQVSGSPLAGHNRPPAGEYSLMTFRGNKDDTIPYNQSAEDQAVQEAVANGTIAHVPEGAAVSNDGFFYVEERLVMAAWSSALQCQHPEGVVFDPYGDGIWVHDNGLRCWNYGPCGQETGLVSCLFDGKHHMPWNNCDGASGCLDPQSWTNRTEGERNVYAHGVFNRVAFHFMLQHPKRAEVGWGR